MMAAEGPLIAAVIARMSEAKFNLAAYGVAYSFALIAEAPIIMIMSAATALVKNNNSFLKLRNFTYSLNLILTVLVLLTLMPSIFSFFTETLIGLPSDISELTYKAVWILLPWPAAIGYRRFFHGILIKNGLTRRVAVTTVIRLITMSSTAIGLFLFSELEGVVVGASALTAGVVLEAIASRIMANEIVNKIKCINNESEDLTYSSISKFYYPLALTALLSLGVHPIVTFFMGQSVMAIESLAVLPVVNALVFIFRSLGLSYQEVAIALMGNKMEGYRPLRNFAVTVASVEVFTLILIAFTPLAIFWFHDISGLSIELSNFALWPLRILSIIPVLSFLISFQRSTLVFVRNTKPITMATITEVMGIILTLVLLTIFLEAPGAIAAATGYIIGRAGSVSYLFPSFLRAVKPISKLESL